ncbi:hypothetical protein BDZ45DRAFT_776448 [Acephala macrosclerotiorum]|nr:hypothetical protein BDZ45DRAFT_776448 [Acephala macrosclerotiorum]
MVGAQNWDADDWFLVSAYAAFRDVLNRHVVLENIVSNVERCTFQQEELIAVHGRNRQEFEDNILRNRAEFDSTVFGNDGARRQSIPAYTFTKSPEPPLEIQLRIWHFASRWQGPRIYAINRWNDEVDYVCWDQHKVLVDLLLKRNTTRPLGKGVQEDIERLWARRNLILDLRIFAAIPVDLWAEFTHVERLTIALSPKEFVGEFEDERVYE